MKKNTYFDFSNFYKMHKKYLPNNIQPSNKFLVWLIGLTEGEGSFIINNRGDLSFVITQSTVDIDVLYYIQTILGFGKVIPQSLKTSRYVPQNKREIEIIISLFNGNIVLPSKKEKFIFYIKQYNKWVTKGNIRLDTVVFKDNFILPSIDNNWFLGFTDAEGCFSCFINKKGFTFNFSIAQKGENNIIVLKQFIKLFNTGIVSEHHVKGVYEYRINGLKNCINIFNYFDKYVN